ncbi:MAG: S41 family peptidase [Candidatus Nealsonbacteria bacterium]|nr:S41 family peptidase [Candidatus Nealsonbacteria bacterium]
MKNIIQWMKNNKDRFNILVFVVIFLVVFSIGYQAGKINVACKVCAPEKVDMSLFWDVWDRVSEGYIDHSKIDQQKMIYGATSGMVKSLGDPYTVFFSPEENKSFSEDVKGSFEGVGMEIDIRKNQLQVVSPIEGTPAFNAGIKAADKILKIDDLYTADMTVEEAVSHIKGPKGTSVTLTIFRDGWDNSKEIKITRDVIEVPSVKWELKNDGKEDIAYIKLSHFNENTAYKFFQITSEISNSPAKKIVLDLRNNPGGYLEVAVNIAGWFLDRNKVVTIEDFGGKQTEEILKASGNPIFLNYPTVILINQGSASASEILAAALRENNDIKLIGEKSFGKGSVQELQSLFDGSSLKMTIAHWLTPDKNLINEKGLEPDIKVEVTEDNSSDGKDPQLEKALEIISNMK